MNDMNRKQRRAARTEGHLDSAAFLKLADKFIDVANQQNKRVNATQVHLACLYASARYSAYVANTILGVPNHEDFVREMTAKYQEMLRQHLADPSLAKPAQT
ncbi:MAG: DUF3144 domain-containing protein [Alphaproteobacteria bacterium]|jgi:hypothetical protein|nr:MAG: DUF3144 domain-containing protein [Alphaproteobacteria bacterium]